MVVEALIGGTPSVRAEIPLSPEEILSKKGEWFIDITTSMLVDHDVRIDVSPPTSFEISPERIIDIPGTTTIKEQEARRLTSSVGVTHAFTSRLEAALDMVWDFSSTNHRVGDSNSSNHDTDFRNLSFGLNWLVVKEDSHPAVVATFDTVVLEKDEIILFEKVLRDRVWFRSFSVGTAIYRQLDPVVLSGNLSYQLGLDRKIENVRFRPGEVGAWSLIVIFAANERLSISSGISGAVRRSEKIRGSRVGTTRNDVSLIGGISLVLSSVWYTTVSIEGGLTDLAPDAVITFKIARRFKKNKIENLKGGDEKEKF